MLSQDKDRQAWQVKMDALTRVTQEEQAKKDELLALEVERKNAERELVNKIADKQKAAKALRSDIQKKKAQERRLARQEKALKRLLDGLADTLLASDKKGHATSIRKQKGRLAWPLKGPVMVAFGSKTSTGVKLSGVHIAPAKRSEQGRLVHALGEGQVRYADWFGGYGLMMIVDYGHGIMAVYAHNDALHKQLGDWVEKSEVIAEAGSTGWVDDVRLYFEIRDKGKPVNPARWCRK
jgi:septal ring factor EnvC (AmiA/AmiB activator)